MNVSVLSVTWQVLWWVSTDTPGQDQVLENLANNTHFIEKIIESLTVGILVGFTVGFFVGLTVTGEAKRTGDEDGILEGDPLPTKFSDGESVVAGDLLGLPEGETVGLLVCGDCDGDGLGL